ncbi:MAG TPA: palindromic element RPE4 domain-containing protein [Rickettsia endosymbiont of Pyrocoelia pectoralis]|nr:palindromic element RPE4 domain-containing protein [Rickettsia endosymbiont of Pyrocoelia pectoralis]
MSSRGLTTGSSKTYKKIL